MKMKEIGSLAAFLLSSAAFAAHGGSDGGGGSRFYCDTLKIQALVTDPKLEESFRPAWNNGNGFTLDAIELIGIDNGARVISYRVRSGKCQLEAKLTWDEGMSPNYRLVSTGPLSCAN